MSYLFDTNACIHLMKLHETGEQDSPHDADHVVMPVDGPEGPSD